MKRPASPRRHPGWVPWVGANVCLTKWRCAALVRGAAGTASGTCQAGEQCETRRAPRRYPPLGVGPRPRARQARRQGVNGGRHVLGRALSREHRAGGQDGTADTARRFARPEAADRRGDSSVRAGDRPCAVDAGPEQSASCRHLLETTIEARLTVDADWPGAPLLSIGVFRHHTERTLWSRFGSSSLHSRNVAVGFNPFLERRAGTVRKDQPDRR